MKITFTFPENFHITPLGDVTVNAQLTTLAGVPGIEFRYAGRAFAIAATETPELAAMVSRANQRAQEALGVSETHAINTRACAGQGLIEELPVRDSIPCSTGCATQVDPERPWKYSQVFAVVRHPKYGVIAVTQGEFSALGLPEISGYC